MKKDDDEDDAPTYVIEETNQSLSKEEYDALVSGKDGKEEEETATDEVGEKKDNGSITIKGQNCRSWYKCKEAQGGKDYQ